MYYTQKFNSTQCNYETIKKKLFSIVETLKEYWDMLLGSEIHVCTNHENLTHEPTACTTQWALHWHLLLEESGPTFYYKLGDTNFIADALSHIPTSCLERETRNIINEKLIHKSPCVILLMVFIHFWMSQNWLNVCQSILNWMTKGDSLSNLELCNSVNRPVRPHNKCSWSSLNGMSWQASGKSN